MSEAPPILVLYGSQTGTAEDAAHRVVREGKRRHFRIKASAMDDYDISQLINEQLVIFICATTGQGEPPDNMKRFWKFLLRRNLPADSLCRLLFTIFGFGDSSYAQYNFMAKRLYNRLVQLSANSFYGRGMGDDQHELGPDATLEPWLEGLWNRLLVTYPLPKGVEIIRKDVTPPPRYRIRTLEGLKYEGTRDHTFEAGGVNQVPGRSSEWPLCGQMTVNKRLTSENHFQDVRHIEICLQDSEKDITGDSCSTTQLSYNPGDIFCTRPLNSEETIEWFLERFQLSKDIQISLDPTDKEDILPPKSVLMFPCTWHDVAEKYLDLSRVPRKYFFELLAYFTTSEDEKEKLLDLVSPEGQNDLWDYCYRPKRTAMEVLEDFPHTKGNIPIEYVFDLFPCIQPRAFSIASCPDVHGPNIHLTVALVEFQTIIRKKRKGLCSEWLKRLGLIVNGGKFLPSVYFWIKPGTMKLPSSADTPVVMIGPGTGCAPFRSMLHKRVCMGAKENVFFFGCRYREKDYLYGEEWEALSHSGKICLHVAFSRDQEKKRYVQHCVREQGKRLYELVAWEEAYVFIAGNSTRMPTDVTEAFEEIAQEYGGKTEAESVQFFKNLQKLKRFQIEAWS
eukprot:Nk52_evm25s246 gene=Nk52_evmTU25s246